jgi:hypothetical protein
MFLIPDSPHEVNITHHQRKTIDAQLVEISTKGLSKGIFDTVIDHVLDLLFHNSFISFCKSKE